MRRGVRGPGRTRDRRWFATTAGSCHGASADRRTVRARRRGRGTGCLARCGRYRYQRRRTCGRGVSCLWRASAVLHIAVVAGFELLAQCRAGRRRARAPRCIARTPPGRRTRQSVRAIAARRRIPDRCAATGARDAGTAGEHGRRTRLAPRSAPGRTAPVAWLGRRRGTFRARHDPLRRRTRAPGTGRAQRSGIARARTRTRAAPRSRCTAVAHLDAGTTDRRYRAAFARVRLGARRDPIRMGCGRGAGVVADRPQP